MTPYEHAKSSAEAFGGIADNYVDIHNWFDETKQFTGDWTHRAVRHHAVGVEMAVAIHGDYIMNSDGDKVPVKMVAELHIVEDCGFIPTIQDWLRPLKSFPEDWMLRVKKKSVKPMEVSS